MLEIESKLLEEIYAESKRGYPHEACGFVAGTIENGVRNASRVFCCRNIQNELHAKDPVRYPRQAETAYTIDPKEMADVEKQAQAQGLKLLSIFHSHPEHGVYFSAEDKEMAAPWGEPLFPELSYLVVSVYAGEVKNASEFYWDANAKDFVENKIL